MLLKGAEFNVPRKTLARVDYKASSAFRDQMVSGRVNLLERLYKQQSGIVGKQKNQIARGVI